MVGLALPDCTGGGGGMKSVAVTQILTEIQL